MSSIIGSPPGPGPESRVGSDSGIIGAHRTCLGFPPSLTASLPGWVEQILEGSPVVPLRGRGGRPDVVRRDANGWRQVSTAVANARALDVLTFQQAVMDAFAAGFAAFSAWYGGRDAFPRALATASAVGTSGSDLVLHCLAAESPGQPVEN